MEKLFVIKVGGAVVEDPAALSAFLKGFAAVDGLKVLVHGGGRAATKVAAQLGVETKMVDGRRITDAEMLRVVTMVYGGLVNKNIVAALQAGGINALGLTGADLGCMLADKRPVKEVDYGFVGDMRKVDTSILADLIARGVVPVMAPLSFDRDPAGRNNAQAAVGIFIIENEGVMLTRKAIHLARLTIDVPSPVPPEGQ